MKIEIEYQKFFKEFDINSSTGVLNNFDNIKFATMPYIGSKYETSNTKILFVGMDIGKDETEGRFQNLKERTINIEKDTEFNPHIAGTYCSSLFLLKDENNWNDVWNKFVKYQTYSQATKIQNHLKGENPLSFVALTNLHKFVTLQREKRSGDLDRKFLKRETEEQLLLKEIIILNPKLILFQGKLPSKALVEKIKEMKIGIILASHPSYRKKGGRKPENYIETFKEI